MASRNFKQKKDWTYQPPAPGHRPPPMSGEQRLLANRHTPNPLAVKSGGFREGDRLILSWMTSSRPNIAGCRVSAMRREGEQVHLLRWTMSGWLREPGGKFLYAPYLTTRNFLDSFVEMVGCTSGFTPILENETVGSLQFRLETVHFQSRRLLPGDQLDFDSSGQLHVWRFQGNLDRSLYQPTVEENGVVSDHNVGYLTLPHHPFVIARMLAEMNGLQAKMLGGREFQVVPF